MKIAILCSDDAHHDFLVAVLRSRFPVELVVREPARSQIRRWRRVGRYRDWFWWSYHAWRQRLFGLHRLRRRFFADRPRPLPGAAPPTVLEVDWINDLRVVAALRRAAPYVTVVMGTRILGGEVLAAAGETVINVHGGYLPDYRGNHCIFFPIYDGRFDRLGCSLHFVDRDVDSGDLIEVLPETFRLADRVEEVYCRGEKAAVLRLAELLAALEAGRPLPRHTSDRRGRLIRMRDRGPRHDLLLWLRRLAAWLGVPTAWTRRWREYRRRCAKQGEVA